MREVFRGFALFACLVLASPAWAGLSVSPLTQNANPGDSITVDVTATGVPANEVISFYGVLLGYDASVLTPTAVTFYGGLGGPLDSIFYPDPAFFDPLTVDPNTLGFGTYSGMFDDAVEVSELSLLDDISGDFFPALDPLQTADPLLLFTVSFDVSAAAPDGTYLFELMDDSFFSDPPVGGEFDVKGRTSNVLNLGLTNGDLVIGASAPMPGTALLMLPFLFAGLRMRRRLVAA